MYGNLYFNNFRENQQQPNIANLTPKKTNKVEEGVMFVVSIWGINNA